MNPSSTRPKKTAHNADTKAAALAALLAGQGVSEVAQRYKIPENTVKSWKKRLKNSDGGAKGAEVAPAKKAEVGDLLVDYLRENLAALKVQASVFADPVWLRQQSAADVAVLHGVMTDKSVRLIEALSHADEGTAQ